MTSWIGTVENAMGRKIYFFCLSTRIKLGLVSPTKYIDHLSFWKKKNGPLMYSEIKTAHRIFCRLYSY